jgi:hypothetical protein
MSGSGDSLCAQRATDVCVAVGVADGVAVVATVDSLCAQRATDVCVAVGVADGLAVVATVDSLCAQSATDISVAVGVADGVAVVATVGVSEGVSDVHSPYVQRTCELYLRLLKRF